MVRDRRIYNRQYNLKHKDKKCRLAREYNKRMRDAVFAILGNLCKRCGFTDERALQIDHVHGGGCKEKRNMTVNYYKMVLQKLLAKSSDYQILCANCNWIKKRENNEVYKGKI